LLFVFITLFASSWNLFLGFFSISFLISNQFSFKNVIIFLLFLKFRGKFFSIIFLVFSFFNNISNIFVISQSYQSNLKNNDLILDSILLWFHLSIWFVINDVLSVHSIENVKYNVGIRFKSIWEVFLI